MEAASVTTQSVATEFTRWLVQCADRLIGRSKEEASSGTLNQDTFARFDNPRGLRITCLSGALWLTIDGEPQDTVLEAGQSIACEHDAPLLISAFKEAKWHAV